MCGGGEREREGDKEANTQLTQFRAIVKFV